jgi:hypothetical protein
MRRQWGTGVLVVLGLLAIVVAAKLSAIHAQMAQDARDRRACIHNLQAIDAARAKWASEHLESAGRPIGAQEVNEIIRHLKDERMPRCPANGTYWIDEAGRPTCSCEASLGHKLEGR